MRKIYGPVFDDTADIWRLRTNAELYPLYRDVHVVQFIKARRIEWFGHVIRMPDGRTPSKFLHGNIIGKRRVGRPRKRWIQDVEENLQTLGVTGWRQKAKDRNE